MPRTSLLRYIVPIVSLWLSASGGSGAQPVLYNGWDLRGIAESHGTLSAEESTSGGLLVLGANESEGFPAWQALTEAGFEVLGYIPRGGFLVFAKNPAEALESLRQAKASFDFALHLRSEWKIHPLLSELPDDLGSRGARAVGVVVHATRITEDLCRAVVSAGGSITNKPSTPGKARLGVEVPSRALDVFRKTISVLPTVYAIEPAGRARLFNDNASAIVQSGSAAGERSIWHRGLHGEGQVICVLDTGLDFDSCYFAEDNATTPSLARGIESGEPDLTRRKVLVYDLLYPGDFAAGPTDFDNQGHGTFVAGNATGSRRDMPLAEDVKNGMAPSARLIIQDGGFIGSDPCSDLPALGCPVVDLSPFLDQAVAQGANIHNDSWGDREDYFPQNTYTAPTADMDDAVWRHPEFLIVCAAGNSGSLGSGSVASPSVGKNVLSVGATQSPSLNGDPEQVTSFSSLGYAADGRYKPDLTAPGQTSSASSDHDTRTGNCTTGLIQGTSMASPLAAGSAALVRQYFVEGWYPTGQKNPADGFVPTAALLKAVLLNGAVPMTGVPAAPPNRTEGWGRIHLENSLYFEGDARRILVVDQRDEFTTESLHSFVLRFVADGNPAAGPAKITLVWTDPPASPGASVALVNDLDLQVADLETTATYRGNFFGDPASANGFSVPGGSPDVINNIEMVILPATTIGLFEVRVAPTRLVVPPQGFALVIGGSVHPAEAIDGRDGWILY